MSITEDYTRAYRIAKHYYLDNLSQSQIAKIENISRPQVSRILKKCREIGIVDINIRMPIQVDIVKLAQELEKYLGLKKVIISPVYSNDSEESRNSLATTAAEHLDSVLPKYSKVGIGWGRTMFQTSMQLAYNNNDCSSMTFVPLVANSTAEDRYLQTSIILDRFAEKFISSKCVYMNEALYSRLPSTSLQLEKIRQIWEELEVVVIGLGGATVPFNLPYINEFGQENSMDMPVLRTMAYGDILGQFFMCNGEIYSAPDGYYLVALEVEQLKNIKDVICIANGEKKVEGLINLAQRGYFKSLITDRKTANEMWNILKKEIL